MIGRAKDVNIKILLELPFILNFKGKALKIERKLKKRGCDKCGLRWQKELIRFLLIFSRK
jgi:hypothetical protein